MTTEVLIKGFFALIFSGMFAWMVFDRDSDSNMDSNRQRYFPYICDMVTIRHILFTLFAVLAFTLEVSGRDTTVKHYNVSTGLSGDRIFSLAQDSLGFIWCASHWGIDRLDGRSVKTYYPQHNGETVNLY